MMGSFSSLYENPQHQVCQREIAITGMGCVLPCGVGVDSLLSTWSSQKTAVSTYHPVKQLAFSKMPWYGGVDVEVTEQLLAKLPKRIRRFSTVASAWGLDSAKQAIEQAQQSGIDWYSVPEGRRGIFTAQGGIQEADFFSFLDSAKSSKDTIVADNDFTEMTLNAVMKRKTNPFLLIRGLSNNLMGLASLQFSAKGDCGAFIRDSEGAAAALKNAMRSLEEGDCDIALLIAAGTFNDPLTLMDFIHSDIVCQADSVKRFGLFNEKSLGLVLGEGASALVLVRQENNIPKKKETCVNSLGLLQKCHTYTSQFDQFQNSECYSASHSIYEKILENKDLSDYDFVIVEGRGISSEDRWDLLNLSKALVSNRTLPITSVRTLTGYLGAAGLYTDIIACASALSSGKLSGIPHLTQPLLPDLGLLKEGESVNVEKGALILNRGFQGGFSAVGLLAAQ